jgi:hypothetical protein
VTNPFDENAPATDNSGVTASIKNHAGYDASMIVFKAGSAAGLAAILEDTDSVGRVIELVADADKLFHEKAGPPAGSKPTAGASGRPASATQHPTGKKMYCEHDGKQVERLYKTGVVKSGKNAGKAWTAFDCPRNDPDHPRIWDN